LIKLTSYACFDHGYKQKWELFADIPMVIAGKVLFGVMSKLLNTTLVSNQQVI